MACGISSAVYMSKNSLKNLCLIISFFKSFSTSPHESSLLGSERTSMLLGYMRFSKADGSQVLDLQRDALLAAGVAADRLYEDLASGRHESRPGLEACLKARS